MTYTHKKTTSIIVMATLIITFSMPAAFADHPLITGWTHASGDTDICYLTSEYDSMLIGGAYIQGSLVPPEIDDAIDDWNGQSSSFSFDFQSGTSCGRTFGASNLSGGLVGLTTVAPPTPGYITDVDTDFDTSGRNWVTGDTCTDADNPNIEYVATHELGHWITFDDASSGGSSHTVMWGSYNCNALDVQTDDGDELDDVY